MKNTCPSKDTIEMCKTTKNGKNIYNRHNQQKICVLNIQKTPTNR